MATEAQTVEFQVKETGERLDKSQINQADLVITPDMLGIEIYDWKNFDQAIELGYQAAQKALVNLSIA